MSPPKKTNPGWPYAPRPALGRGVPLRPPLLSRGFLQLHSGVSLPQTVRQGQLGGERHRGREEDGRR